jgi:hypothetical protein
MKDEALTIHFTVPLYLLKQWTVARLPEAASKSLPSRGQVAVTGTINGHEFNTVLEPDGSWGHWLRVEAGLLGAAGISAGDTVKFELTVTKKWPEPKLPKDVADALKAAPQKVKEKWQDITPMARWEWIRWVNATANAETRAVRIEKTVSKLNGTHRRPCCFNLAACTDPDLAKNGHLIESAS